METKTGRVVVVTGAGSGIGRACAVGLLAAGYRVVLAGRKAEALAATASEAGAAAGRALVVPTDVTDPAAVNALFARVGEAFGRVDVLFNNAGVNAPPVALEDLAVELQRLVDAPPEQIETTVLIHPRVLQDFVDFNDFLDIADEALQTMGLEGEIQIASFHPQYQFAGTGIDDIGNETNRSPYPTLHLLREESVARAVDAFGDTGSISAANLATLQMLGPEGLAAVKRGGPG